MSCENTINKLVYEVCKLKKKNNNNDCCEKLEDEINKVLEFNESNNLRMTNFMNNLNNEDNIILCNTKITFPNIRVNNPDFDEINFINNSFNDILGALGLRNFYFISKNLKSENPFVYESTFEIQSYQLDFCNQILQSINNNIVPIFWSQMTVTSSGNQINELLNYTITPFNEVTIALGNLLKNKKNITLSNEVTPQIPNQLSTQNIILSNEVTPQINPGPSSIPKNIAILSPLNDNYIKNNKLLKNNKKDTESSQIYEQTEEFISKNNIQTQSTNNSYTELSLLQSTEDIEERLRKLLENTESSTLSDNTEEILKRFS